MIISVFVQQWTSMMRSETPLMRASSLPMRCRSRGQCSGNKEETMCSGFHAVTRGFHPKHSPESKDVWLFAEGKLVLLRVWRQLLDDFGGQVTQPAVRDPQLVFSPAAERDNVGDSSERYCFSGIVLPNHSKDGTSHSGSRWKKSGRWSFLWGPPALHIVAVSNVFNFL